MNENQKELNIKKNIHYLIKCERPFLSIKIALIVISILALSEDEPK
jgi:hypothetical protein